jgi:hypothetical protein
MARLRIDEPDRLDLRLEFVQHRNELSLRDCGVGEIVLQLCEPVTGASGVTDCRTIASLIRSTDRYYGFPIKPLAHLFSSFEEGNGFLCDRDDGASTRVAPRLAGGFRRL